MTMVATSRASARYTFAALTGFAMCVNRPGHFHGNIE